MLQCWLLTCTRAFYKDKVPKIVSNYALKKIQFFVEILQKRINDTPIQQNVVLKTK